jgi:hypothetical protein
MYRATTGGHECNMIENDYDGQWFWAVVPHSEFASDLDLGLFYTKHDAMAALAQIGAWEMHVEDMDLSTARGWEQDLVDALARKAGGPRDTYLRQDLEDVRGRIADLTHGAE